MTSPLFQGFQRANENALQKLYRIQQGQPTSLSMLKVNAIHTHGFAKSMGLERVID
jgi:hypothetical protein